MNSRNTVVRSMHDVGAAGWFGGSLMGAVALNGASKDVSDPAERSKIAVSGWARWAPVAAVAIVVPHRVGTNEDALVVDRDFLRRARHTQGSENDCAEAEAAQAADDLASVRAYHADPRAFDIADAVETATVRT